MTRHYQRAPARTFQSRQKSQEQTMNHERVNLAIANLLQRLKQEYGEESGSRVLVPAPNCSLDSESYELLLARTGGWGYSRVFNSAVQAVKPIVSKGQFTQVFAAVKKGRSNYRSKAVRTRMGKAERKWIEETAKSMQVKPSRIMEAVLFLYLRSEEQEPGGEN